MKPLISAVLSVFVFSSGALQAQVTTDASDAMSRLKEKYARGGQKPEAPAASAAAPPAAAARAPDPEFVDLRPQFSDGANRNQCDVGSCHAFGAIGVLEAAYFRKNGKTIKLSEADLFLQKTVLTGDIYNQFCSDGKCKVSEGNSTKEDLRHAIDKGVATNLSYSDFLERWRKFRAAEQATMEGIKRQSEEDSKGFYGWVASFLYDPKAHWKELSTSDQSRKILERYLGGNSDLSGSREAVRKELAGVSLSTKDFAYLGGPKARDLGDAGCRREGEKQAQSISAELKAGRPVVISMSLGGLLPWGQTDATEHANHAFVLTGQRKDKDILVFETRNSWGGDNPSVPQNQFCRIYSVSSVLIPGEKAAF